MNANDKIISAPAHHDFDRIVGDEPALSVCFGTTRIDILGTAHVSKPSSRVVGELIQTFKYDCVAVELCAARLAALMDELPDLDLWKVMRQGRLGELTAMLALSAHQQRIAEQLGMEPGAEMKTAAAGAREQGIPLVCIDREVGVTMRRLSATLPWWQRTALIQLLVYNMFRRDKVSEEQVEELKSNDHMQEMFGELMRDHKDLYRTLIFERDNYMAIKIMEHLKKQDCSRMLVVVGAGHLGGLATTLRDCVFPISQSQISRSLDSLCLVARRFRWMRVVPWIIVVLILFGFALGFDKGIGLSLVVDWVLINGGLAALGVLLAGGHWVTVVSGFLAAPLTSINPMIGAGMVTAAVELTVRKPHVSALRTLRKDTTKWSGWRKNPIARTLLVFVFSTLGSLFGTYIGGIHIFNQI